jgi:alkanesulfonate monooxygenase SsuD/methylene tetrahydromethanopterin reductase-like flavin-dependent oxidoreductase (luciferase family)
VPPYHSPWRLVEEIGMLDHLTGGRLEIGTSPGIPPEMAQVGLSVEEARARYDEAVEIIDQALAEPVISHHGKFWNFDNMRLTPRTIQQPHPPKWVTVVSASSARKAARRGAKISTGFHPQDKVIEIFDAYRDEAAKAGRKARPDDLCLRRQVVMDEDKEALARRRVAYRDFLKFDPRLNHPDRPALDTPLSHSFTIGDEEFIGGAPAAIAEEIAAQCSAAGAGHFAGLFDRLISPAQTAEVYRVFGEAVIPKLRATPV